MKYPKCFYLYAWHIIKVLLLDRMSKNITLTEDQECYLLKEYLDILMKQGKVFLYTHLAQETFTKNFGTKMKNKRMGVYPGFPDYCILLPSIIVFIEMKRRKGGKLTDAQQEWIIELNNYNDCVHAFVCYGFDEAKKLIDNAINR